MLRNRPNPIILPVLPVLPGLPGLPGLAIQVVLVVFLATIVGCSGSDVASPPTTPSPPELTLAEPAAPAGSTVRITGLDPAQVDLDQVQVEIDGEPTLLLRNENGEVHIMPPLNVDLETFRVIPSNAPMDVTFQFPDGSRVELPAAVNVLVPEPDPGASARVLAAMESYLDSWDTILNSLPIQPGVEEQAMVTIVPLLRSMLFGEGEDALERQLAAMDEKQLALLDNLWGATDLPEQMTELASLSAPVASKLATRGKSAIELDDTELALLMQFSVYSKRYAEWYLHGLSQGVAGVNAVGGTISLLVQRFLSGPLRGTIVARVMGIANFVYALSDFILSKHLVALMPTRVDSIELSLAETELSDGDYTQSSRRINVSNDPPATTLNDFITQLLNGVGIFIPTDDVDYQLVLGISVRVVNTINGLINGYSQEHPELLTPAELYEVPDIEWTAVLDNPILFDARTLNTNLLDIDSAVGEWKARATQGDASVFVQPSSDDDAIGINLGVFEYNAGAFGEDIVASNNVQVRVRQPLGLEVSFAGSISPDGANALGVKAGTRNEDGSIDYRAGISISLSTTGGFVEDSSGLTDQDGEFITLARLNPGSSRIDITITATDAFGNQTEETATAVATAESQVTVAEFGIKPFAAGHFLLTSAYANDIQETPASMGDPCGDPAIPENYRTLAHDERHQFAWDCNSQATLGRASASASATATCDLELVHDTSGQYLQKIHWDGSATLEGSMGDCVLEDYDAAIAVSRSDVSYIVNVDMNVPVSTLLRVRGRLVGGSIVFVRRGTEVFAEWRDGLNGGLDLDEAVSLTPGSYRVEIYGSDSENINCDSAASYQRSASYQVTFEFE